MKLKIFSREISGKKVKNLRLKEAQIPAVMYGPKYASHNVSLDAKEFAQIFAKAGYSTMIQVQSEEGNAEKVLVKEVQQHPVKDYYIHVSLYVIDANTPISADVPLEFVGTSPAEALGTGFVAFATSSIAVRCLPKDLPANLVVDITRLKDAGESILARDIKLPEGVALDSKQDEGAAVAYIAEAQKIEDVLAEIEAGNVAAGETTEETATEEGAETTESADAETDKSE